MSDAPTPIRQRSGGLGRTLSLAFLVLALLPALVSGFVLYQRASATLEQSALAQDESLADLRRIDVITWVNQRERTLAALARDADLLAALEPGRTNPAVVSTWLEQHANDDPAFAAILIINAGDGQIWAASETRATRVGQVFPGWKSVRPDGVSPARYEPGLSSDRLTLLFATPIDVPAPDSEGWTIVGESSITDLQRLVSSLSETPGTLRAYLVTPEGDPLIGINGSAPVPVEGEIIRAAASAQDGSGRFAGEQAGQTMIGAYRWLGDSLGLALIVEQNALDAAAPLNSAIGWALLALVPTLAVLGIVVWWLVKRQLAPLQTLSEAALRLSGSNLNASLPQLPDDEIGAVGAAFTRMSNDLRRQFSALEAQATARAKTLSSAEAVLAATAAPQRLDVLLARACNAIQEQFGSDAVLIFVHDDQDRRLHLRAATEPAASRLLARGLAYAIEPATFVGWTAVERSARLAPDVREDNLYTPLPELPDVRAALALPMLLGEDVIGVLLLEARQPGVFTQTDLAVYQIMADHLAVSIANSRQFERSQRTRLVEDVIVALAEQVSQTTDPERVLTIGARVLGSALDARRAIIRLGPAGDSHGRPAPIEEAR